jgi:hypothetical protein
MSLGLCPAFKAACRSTNLPAPQPPLTLLLSVLLATLVALPPVR